MRSFLLGALFLVGCCPSTKKQDPLSFSVLEIKEPLARVNIVDCNGLSETITLTDRLKDLSRRNFLDPQPFRKVMRTFLKDGQGRTRSIITSYYDSGHIRQYLECSNGRACGSYLEWHQNGKKKIQARVCAGVADLNDKAFSSWSFDGPCFSWEERGSLRAVFSYQHGKLHGPATVFFPSGEKERDLFYVLGLQEGKETLFYKGGDAQEILSFSEDLRHGVCQGFKEGGELLWEEAYEKGLLDRGSYFGSGGGLLSSVSGGAGLRSVFENGELVEQHEISQGRPEGRVSLFSEDGRVAAIYSVREGKKEGEEVRFFPGSSSPRLSLEWKEGLLHGNVKTWYENGQLESQREMSQNNKQGVALAWYSNGSLMLAEEYEKDRLLRGQYLKKGDPVPISVVENGAGHATLFDDSGAVVEKIPYEDGAPSPTS